MGKALDLNHIKHVSLSSSRLGMRRAIQQFREDDDTRVFLLALRQGAAGGCCTAPLHASSGMMWQQASEPWMYAPCRTVVCQAAHLPYYVTVASCQCGAAADIQQGVWHQRPCQARAYLRHACPTAQACGFLCTPVCSWLTCAPHCTAGLTLVRASHVFLLEPALDPAIEQQAVARVHRIGQQRPVHITRLLMRDSVEMEVSRVLPAGLAGQAATKGYYNREVIIIVPLAATCSQACCMWVEGGRWKVEGWMCKCVSTHGGASWLRGHSQQCNAQ